jgi:hypothetical protein
MSSVSMATSAAGAAAYEGDEQERRAESGERGETDGAGQHSGRGHGALLEGADATMAAH